MAGGELSANSLMLSFIDPLEITPPLKPVSPFPQRPLPGGQRSPHLWPVVTGHHRLGLLLWKISGDWIYVAHRELGILIKWKLASHGHFHFHCPSLVDHQLNSGALLQHCAGGGLPDRPEPGLQFPAAQLAIGH